MAVKKTSKTTTKKSVKKQTDLSNDIEESEKKKDSTPVKKTTKKSTKKSAKKSTQNTKAAVVKKTTKKKTATKKTVKKSVKKSPPISTDRNLVSCEQEHELLYILVKFGKKQTKENIEKLRDACIAFKKDESLSPHNRDGFYEYIKFSGVLSILDEALSYGESTPQKRKIKSIDVENTKESASNINEENYNEAIPWDIRKEEIKEEAKREAKKIKEQILAEKNEPLYASDYKESPPDEIKRKEQMLYGKNIEDIDNTPHFEKIKPDLKNPQEKQSVSEKIDEIDISSEDKNEGAIKIQEEMKREGQTQKKKTPFVIVIVVILILAIVCVLLLLSKCSKQEVSIIEKESLILDDKEEVLLEDSAISNNKEYTNALTLSSTDKENLEKPVEKKEVPKPTENYIQSYRVKHGDKLWTIAKRYYRDGRLWPLIYVENRTQIEHPDFPKAGSILKIVNKRKSVESLSPEERNQLGYAYREVYKKYKSLGMLREGRWMLYFARIYDPKGFRKASTYLNREDVEFTHELE